MSLRAARCTHCGAPARAAATSCAYCGVGLVRDAPAKAAPSGSEKLEARIDDPRAARLRRALADAGAEAFWDRGRAAWSRRARVGVGSLSPEESSDASRLGAMLATAYAAAFELAEISPDAFDRRVAAMWSFLDGRVERDELDAAMNSWDALLAEGEEAFAGRLAAALPNTDERRAAFELAAAAACPDGRFTGADEALFGELATVFGITEAEAEQIAERVARAV